MSVFADGVGSCQSLDSSGEVVLLEGLDISSLVGAPCNWEHLKDTPATVIGKILKAKKIFSEKDCEDDRELYYWNKCLVPYLYVLIEILDGWTDSGRAVAGILRYDAEHRGETGMDLLGFSVEGAKIPGAIQGNVITRSIARKITITSQPCNKQAIAEMVPAPETKKDNLDDIFKTESTTEIRIFKNDKIDLLAMLKKEDPQKHADALGIDPMKKAEPPKSPMAKPKLNLVPKTSPLPKNPNAQQTPAGSILGQTKTGKSVLSHKKVSEYKDFNAQEHRDAANLHYNAAQTNTNPGAAAHHWDKMRMHTSAANTAMDRENRFKKSDKMNKAMDAGSGMAAPGNLAQGAALSPESLDKKKRKIWLQKAEEAYSKWDKKEEFRKFMQMRLPALKLSEIDAIGQTVCLKKTLKENPFSEFATGEIGSYKEKGSLDQGVIKKSKK